jgi:putative membrane-bound dehydrogenase-like protein
MNNPGRVKVDAPPICRRPSMIEQLLSGSARGGGSWNVSRLRPFIVAVRRLACVGALAGGLPLPGISAAVGPESASAPAPGAGAGVVAPRSPAEELVSFEFADSNLTAELVVAEPQIISPVALAWDAAGRLFIAEMRDYPNATNGGTIRCLEDRDGDGRYEVATVFADGLRFPNSVLPWNGGVLVTAAPDLIFLRDTDGDHRADERRVLLTGFGTGNQQLRANGLTWGGDGWVYGANGRSDGGVRRPGSTNAGPGVVSLRGRDFRFRPESGEISTVAGRSQFGLAIDEWGNRFLSWNTIPVRHEVFPDAYLAAQPLVAGENVVVDLLPSDDRGQVFPQTPPPLVFNNESSSHFNALAGLTLFRGEALGDTYRGNVFVGETLRNLVHRRVLIPSGATFVARRGESGTEFLRSSDPWFHPVNFATGPDGALYVVDFYRQFVEHPDWVPHEMRDKVSWRVGSEHGRLWRIVRKDQAPASRPNRGPALAGLAPRALVAELDSPNAWRRATAQRLLVEQRAPSAIPALRDLVQGARQPEGRALALATLALIATTDALDEGLLLAALSDPSAPVRAQAARTISALWLTSSSNAASPGPTGGSSPKKSPTPSAAVARMLARLADDPEARVRLNAVMALAFVEDTELREGTLRRRLELESDRWVRLAAAGSSRTLTREQAATVLARPPKPLRAARTPSAAAVDPDRQKVIERLTPALQVAGDRTRGAATFGRLCLACHYLQGRGQRVGPDLSGIATRPPDALLVDLLDPSRQIAPEYAAYEATLADGETVTGLFASETETRVTIRRSGAPDENIPRAQLRGLRPTGKSLMPDGLETGLTLAEVADLLAFLRNPDGALLPP